ncbi:unnamed protein product [Blepharisma stoltei]|uniref:Uncharacterized protein n=1 Tax=Blepharisma stoltei TaxID=1481888 RepID=A0AAU9J7U5_9CILI|nr:unnamed protein product [Blepharisma stoltei]
MQPRSLLIIRFWKLEQNTNRNSKFSTRNAKILSEIKSFILSGKMNWDKTEIFYQKINLRSDSDLFYQKTNYRSDLDQNWNIQNILQVWKIEEKK